MKFTVDGETVIKWSVLVEADDFDSAEAEALKYWEHNTTCEYQNIDGIYADDMNGWGE